MSELQRWCNERGSPGPSSLDWVEIVMGIEAELHADITDDFAEHIEQCTFREFVVHLAGKTKRSGL